MHFIIHVHVCFLLSKLLSIIQYKILKMLILRKWKKKFLLVYVLIKMDTSSLKINYLFLVVIIQILKNNNSIQKGYQIFLYVFEDKMRRRKLSPCDQFEWNTANWAVSLVVPSLFSKTENQISILMVITLFFQLDNYISILLY